MQQILDPGNVFFFFLGGEQEGMFDSARISTGFPICGGRYPPSLEVRPVLFICPKDVRSLDILNLKLCVDLVSTKENVKETPWLWLFGSKHSSAEPLAE